MLSLNGTLKKVGRSGDGKRNNLLGWPYRVRTGAGNPGKPWTVCQALDLGKALELFF